MILAFIRLPLALAGSGIAILAYQQTGNPVGIAAGLGWSTLTLTVVNLICLGLLIWRSRGKATALTTAGFGLQHLVFAVTIPSALAYVIGFFLWGLGAGFIAHRQGQLVPLIIAHFMSNLSFGIIPLFFVTGNV